jgi:excisionase family DNA binding protein
MADMRLMRIEDVAAALGINYRTVREWGQKGRIPTIKIGRFAFVRVAALRQWVADNERGGSNG